MAIAALLCSAAETAAAQGSSIYTPLMRVEAVLDGPEDDRRVVLTGQIVRKIDGRIFLFADATGEIPVEIDEQLITGGYTLKPGTPVEIRGEIETRLLRSPKIAAHTVSVLLPSGLPTIIYKDAGRNER